MSSEPVAIEVRFYDLAGLRAGRNVRNPCLMWAYRTLGFLRGRRESLAHCDVRIGNTVFQCTRRGGCNLRFDDWIEAKPTRIVTVHCRQPDLSWWYEQRRMTTVRTFLRALHLWPARSTVINCVTATCRLLDIDAKLRTPDELLNSIQRGDSHHGR